MRKYTCAMCGSERYTGKACWDCGSDELEIAQESVISLIARRDRDKKIECFSCGKDLTGEPVQVYQHEDGWMTGARGSLPKMRWWLSIECECRYETSFDKFGIKR